MKSVFIIAEAGVNHNGNIDYARKLVVEAKKAGADAIKFQTFKAEKVVTKFAQKANYQKETTAYDESQLEMIKTLELSDEEFLELKKFCDEIGIMFISTPFDLDSIDFLNSLNIPLFKIPSGEITNLPYIIKIAKLKKKVILSTGMSNIEEVEFAINILREYGTDDITILHCNTQYPTPYEDVNLNAMLTLKNKFGLKVGYSDHTLGIIIPIAAVAMGAEVIEKHFTLDKNMEGPDHKASLDIQQLNDMVASIRDIEKALGDGVKKPSDSEIENISIVRKSIVAARNISCGELFTKENLTVKRPGNGISPTRWFEIIGQTATRDFEKDEMIKL